MVRERNADWTWTAAYYGLLVVWLVVVYQQLLVDVVGDAAGNWLAKANEAYLVAIAIPLYWDVVATARRDRRIVPVADPSVPRPALRRIVWYVALLVALAMFEGPLYESLFGDRVPQRILTLRDVMFGLVMISMYFDWSRGHWRNARRTPPALVSARARLLVLLALLAVNIAIYQQTVIDLVGERIANALDFHAEGFAVVFFGVLYFDVVLPLTRGDGVLAVRGPAGADHRHLVLGVWLGLMVFFTWFGQGPARDVFDNGFGQWFVRSPEAPLAAIGFTVYFEIVRRLDGVHSAEVTR